jgi:hypothetical protein
MILTPIDPTQPCTHCDYPAPAHPVLVHPACLEWRHYPEDSVLAAVLQIAALCPAHLGVSQDPDDWMARLKMTNVPLTVPAVRWWSEIARTFAGVGVTLGDLLPVLHRGGVPMQIELPTTAMLKQFSQGPESTIVPQDEGGVVLGGNTR